MTYVEIVVECGIEAIDMAVALLGEISEVQSMREEDTCIKIYTPLEHLERVLAQTKQIASRYQWSVGFHEIPAQNWNEEWEKNFNPLAIGKACWIRAPFHPINPDFEQEIIIEPKNAFGTGHHETTYLMIREMSTLDFREKRVLDFGAGTGILSVWAYKLGARDLTLLDNTIESIENIPDNILVNDQDLENFDIRLGSLEQAHGLYDIILANINLPVILQSLEKLYHLLAIDGQILFSGILIKDKNRVAEDPTFRTLAIRERGDWCMIRAGKA